MHIYTLDPMLSYDFDDMASVHMYKITRVLSVAFLLSFLTTQPQTQMLTITPSFFSIFLSSKRRATRARRTRSLPRWGARRRTISGARGCKERWNRRLCCWSWCWCGSFWRRWSSNQERDLDAYARSTRFGFFFWFCFLFCEYLLFLRKNIMYTKSPFLWQIQSRSFFGHSHSRTPPERFVINRLIFKKMAHQDAHHGPVDAAAGAPPNPSLFFKNLWGCVPFHLWIMNKIVHIEFVATSIRKPS